MRWLILFCGLACSAVSAQSTVALHLDTDIDASTGCGAHELQLTARGQDLRFEACQDQRWVALSGATLQLIADGGIDGSDRLVFGLPTNGVARVEVSSSSADGATLDRIDAAPLGTILGAAPPASVPALLPWAAFVLAFAVMIVARKRLFASALLLLVLPLQPDPLSATAQALFDPFNDVQDASGDLVRVAFLVEDGRLQVHVDLNNVEANGLPAESSVLLIGNSLTYAYDMPDMLQAIAAAAGKSLATTSVTLPGASLEDHFRQRTANSELSSGRHDVVILQQGPSSLPANQVYLRTWTERFAPLIRAGGARPALYMVWPDATRLEFFDDVRQSYSNAALAVDGMFIPAGEAWRAAWSVDPALPLYDNDDFHPSALGAYAAAMSIFCALYQQSPVNLPSRLVHEGSVIATIDPDHALAVQHAAWQAHRAFARQGR